MPRVRFVHRYHDPRLSPPVAREAANDGWFEAANSQPGADTSAPWGDFGARRPLLPACLFTPPMGGR